MIGLDIRSAGDVHQFLPWVAAELDERGVSVRSSFLLVDDGESYARLGGEALSDPDELACLHVDRFGRVLREREPVSTADVAGTRSG